MSGIGQPERATQNRVIALFRDELGYRYLGGWIDRSGNSNIEEVLPKQVRSAVGRCRTSRMYPSERSYYPSSCVPSLCCSIAAAACF